MVGIPIARETSLGSEKHHSTVYAARSLSTGCWRRFSSSNPLHCVGAMSMRLWLSLSLQPKGFVLTSPCPWSPSTYTGSTWGSPEWAESLQAAPFHVCVVATLEDQKVPETNQWGQSFRLFTGDHFFLFLVDPSKIVWLFIILRNIRHCHLSHSRLPIRNYSCRGWNL